MADRSTTAPAIPGDDRSPHRPTEPEPPAEPDVSAEGVDRTLIRWMLGLTPEQRLDALQGFVDSVRELRGDRP
jgi:hypothetical protein